MPPRIGAKKLCTAMPPGARKQWGPYCRYPAYLKKIIRHITALQSYGQTAAAQELGL